MTCLDVFANMKSPKICTSGFASVTPASGDHVGKLSSAVEETAAISGARKLIQRPSLNLDRAPAFLAGSSVQIGAQGNSGSVHSHKLTCADVVSIRIARAARETCDSIAARFGLTNSLVSQIACGKIWKQAGGPIVRMRTRGGDLMAKVWSRIAKDDSEDGCWEWKGRINREGYGVVDHGATDHLAHRLVLSESLGRALGAGEVSRHKCHNRKCARPSHLLPGTPLDNAQDMVDAGRSLYGERSPARKLTSAIVLELRMRAALGRVNCEAAGREFGVTGNAIKHAILGRTWRHLPMPAICPVSSAANSNHLATQESANAI